MADPSNAERINPIKWDGTRPYPLTMAQCAVYPVSEPDRTELNQLYMSGSPHREALPDRIWPQLDASVSIYRTINEEQQFNRPYAKTRDKLQALQRRLNSNANDIAEFYSRDASGRYFFIERFDWADLERKLRNAANVVGQHLQELKE